jgi:hypothetical protein
LSAISTAAAASKAGATANTLSELVKQLNTTQASELVFKEIKGILGNQGSCEFLKLN